MGENPSTNSSTELLQFSNFPVLKFSSEVSRKRPCIHQEEKQAKIAGSQNLPGVDNEGQVDVVGHSLKKNYRTDDEGAVLTDEGIAG